jgi:hypothetical protein
MPGSEINCFLMTAPVVTLIARKRAANFRYKSPMKSTRAAESASPARAIGCG